jgi:hypothetical protein
VVERPEHARTHHLAFQSVKLNQAGLAHHEQNTPQKWTVASCDKAEPGVIVRKKNNTRSQPRKHGPLHARAMLFGRTSGPISHCALHDVQ